MSRNEQPTIEMRQEHATMKKRLARLLRSTEGTPNRKRPYFVRTEIEALQANIANLERRYSFSPPPPPEESLWEGAF